MASLNSTVYNWVSPIETKSFGAILDSKRSQYVEKFKPLVSVSIVGEEIITFYYLIFNEETRSLVDV